MAKATIGFGLALIVVGVAGYGIGLAGYFGTEKASPTALIPAAFGLALVILGFLARKEQIRKHAMHAAAALALLGFAIPAIRTFPKLPDLIADGRIEQDGKDMTTAVILQLVMALICAVFVVLCINSFIAARRARRQPTA